MVVWMFVLFGDVVLKEVWLFGLIGGELFVFYCLIEFDVGFDVVCLCICVCCEGDEYVLDGSKCFIFGVGSIQVLIVMVCIGEDGVRGIFCFLVLVDVFGICYGCNEDKMGWCVQLICIIIFEGVCIFVGNCIGLEGQGFVYVMKGFDGGCLNIVSCFLGVVQVVLEQLMCYVEECEQFGKLLVIFQVLQFKFVDMFIEFIVSCQMVCFGVYWLDCGDVEVILYCVMVKCFVIDCCFDVCNEVL